MSEHGEMAMSVNESTIAESESTESDVVIVGAGPTGLLLAGDLATAGIRVTVLEKRGRESNLTRAFAVHARTLEQLDARGLAEELIATGSTLSSLRLFGRLRVDLSRLPSRFPFLLITPSRTPSGCCTSARSRPARCCCATTS